MVCQLYHGFLFYWEGPNHPLVQRDTTWCLALRNVKLQMGQVATMHFPVVTVAIIVAE